MKRIELNKELFLVIDNFKTQIDKLFEKGLKIEDFLREINEIKELYHKKDKYCMLKEEDTSNCEINPESEEYQKKLKQYNDYMKEITENVFNYWICSNLTRFDIYKELDDLRWKLIKFWNIKRKIFSKDVQLINMSTKSMYLPSNSALELKREFAAYVNEIYNTLYDFRHRGLSIDEIERAFIQIKFQLEQDILDPWERSKDNPNYYKLVIKSELLDRIKPEDIPEEDNFTRRMKKLF